MTSIGKKFKLIKDYEAKRAVFTLQTNMVKIVVFQQKKVKKSKK